MVHPQRDGKLMRRFGIRGRRQADGYEFLGDKPNTANAATYNDTYAVPANGLLIVGFTGAVSSVARVVDSMEIGGDAVDIVARSPASSLTTSLVTSLAAKAVSAGDVSVAALANGTLTAGVFAAWLLYEYTSAVPVDTSASLSNNGTFAAVLDLPPNGLAVCVAGGGNSGRSYSWGGATERYDYGLESNRRYTGADFWSASGETDHAIVATVSTEGSAARWAAASWG